jgi:hypothetical protein
MWGVKERLLFSERRGGSRKLFSLWHAHAAVLPGCGVVHGALLFYVLGAREIGLVRWDEPALLPSPSEVI